VEVSYTALILWHDNYLAGVALRRAGGAVAHDTILLEAPKLLFLLNSQYNIYIYNLIWLILFKIYF